MCNKRLLHKLSFVVLLCMIPIIVPITQNALSGESSILKVAIASEDNSPAAVRAQEHLKNSDSIIKYIQCSSVEEARKMVETYQAYAAWIFKSDLEGRINNFI